MMRRGITFPIVAVRIHDDALHRRCGIVPTRASRFTAVVLRNQHAAPVRIEQHLSRVKPRPVRRIEWPPNPVCVDLTRPQPRHEDMPVVIGSVGAGVDANRSLWPGLIFLVKQQQLYTRCGARKKAEIDAARGDCGAQRETSSGTFNSIFLRGYRPLEKGLVRGSAHNSFPAQEFLRNRNNPVWLETKFPLKLLKRR